MALRAFCHFRMDSGFEHIPTFCTPDDIAAKMNTAPFYHKPFPLDDQSGDFFPGTFDQPGESRPGDLHLASRLFMR